MTRSTFGSYLDTTFITLDRSVTLVNRVNSQFTVYTLYEFSEYAFSGNAMGTDGMRWGDLSDSKNGLKDVLIIMFVEWIVGIFVAYYIDQVSSSGSGKSLLFFLQSFRKKRPTSIRTPSLKRQGSKVFVDMDKPDVIQEVMTFLF